MGLSRGDGDGSVGASSEAAKAKPSFSYLAAASFTFAVFMAFMPWAAIRGYAFVDRGSYAALIENFAALGGPRVDLNHTLNAVTVFTDEMGWRSMVLWPIAQFHIDPQVGMDLVSFLVTAAFALYTVRRSRLPPIVSLLMLVNPIMVDLLYAQLRSAFGASIVYLSISWWPFLMVIVPITIIATSFHTATSIFGLVLLGDFSLARRTPTWLSPKVAALLALLGGMVGGALLAAAAQHVLHLAGDRRGVEGFGGVQSVKYLAFWGLLALGLALAVPPGRRPSFEYLSAITLTAIAVISSVLGVNGWRFVPLAFPLIIIAISELDGAKRTVATIAFCLYSVVLWYYWVAVN